MKEDLEYKGKNFRIYYKPKDKKVIENIEKAILEGYNKAIEYFNIQNYNKEMVIYLYSSIEELHLDVFNEKREEWKVCCGDNNIIKVLSPLNPGKIHDYNAILKIISKAVADVILENNFRDVPNWFGITIYITKLNTETRTFSKPSIKKFKNGNYFNYSDSYFIARYIAETYGRDTVLKILQSPNKYNDILNLSDKELDTKIEEYYS